MAEAESAQSKATVELFSWKAPLRPFKKRNRQFYTTVFAVAALVAIIGYILEGPWTVIVILALVFVVWVLSAIEPEEVEHKITNKGIVFAGSKTYLWRELLNFWFTERFGSHLLIIDMTRLPGRLEFVVDPEEKIKIQEILEKHIELQEATPNFLDKTASWLSKRVPLD